MSQYFGGGGVINSNPNLWVPIGEHGGRVVESWDHVAIHKGQIYRKGVFETLASGSTLTVTITTPTTENIHINLGVDTDGPGIARFYEGATVSGGSVLTALNANRNITTASEVTLAKDPTVTTIGTPIGINVIGSEGFKTVAGGSAESQTWILKPSTTYLLQFTADNDDCRTVLKYIWLED